jgi:hypothetical protein
MLPAHRLAAIVPAQPRTSLAAHRALVEDTLGVALMLTGMVRDEGPAAAAGYLAGLPADQLAVLPFLLAALVDVDRTARELVAWTGWAQPVRYDGATALAPASSLLHAHPRPTRSPECGSEGGFGEHIAGGSPPCTRCLIAHDAHIRDEAVRARKPRRPRRRPAAPARPATRLILLTLPFEDTPNAA